MTDMIARLADVKPPAELLLQVDMAEIFEKFHTTFKRLDDFKNVRDRHEQRGFLGRLFNGKELKEAQLDAQELQAEFSKTLAQLMVISTVQSQQLVEQQKQLGVQQKDLEEKADALASHTRQLETHQANIQQQAAELRRYVTNLLNVQGLTDEHAHRLIEIAEDVTSTRDRLIQQFDARMETIDASLTQQSVATGKSIAELEEQLGTRLATFSHEQLERQILNEQTQAQLHEALASHTDEALAQLRSDTASEQELLRHEQEERHREALAQSRMQHQALQSEHEQLRQQLQSSLALHEQRSATQLKEQNERLTTQSSLLQAELQTLRDAQQDADTAWRRMGRHLWIGLGFFAIASAAGIAGGYLAIIKANPPVFTAPPAQTLPPTPVQ